MRLNLLTILAVLVSVFSFGQFKYEPGYVVNGESQKQNYLILNEEWFENPTYIEVKDSENGQPYKMDINFINEFSFGNVKYVKKTIDVDYYNTPKQSPDYKNTKVKQETLLLQILVEGKQTLYKYRKANDVFFFFDNEKGETKQLVYKKYLSETDAARLITDEQYKTQLTTALKCNDVTESTINRTYYSESALKKLFLKYNQCIGGGADVYGEGKKNETRLKLSVKAGVNMNSYKLYNPNVGGNYINTGFDYSMDLNKQTGFRGGLEFEVVFPFDKKKWSAFIEPSFVSYKAEGNTTYYNPLATPQNVPVNGKLEYSGIEVPIGARYRIPIAPQSDLFLSLGLPFNFSIADITFDVGGQHPRTDLVAEYNFSIDFFFGAGYKYNDRFSAEFRYYKQRSLFIYGTMDQISVILGYTIPLNKKK